MERQAYVGRGDGGGRSGLSSCPHHFLAVASWVAAKHRVPPQGTEEEENRKKNQFSTLHDHKEKAAAPSLFRHLSIDTYQGWQTFT